MRDEHTKTNGFSFFLVYECVRCVCIVENQYEMASLPPLPVRNTQIYIKPNFICVAKCFGKLVIKSTAYADIYRVLYYKIRSLQLIRLA